MAKGRNWRLLGADEDAWLDDPVEEWPIEPTDSLGPSDEAVYSGVYMLEDGQVQPLLLIKEVGSPEYGGDYCEHVEGKWRQVGLEPDPDAPNGQMYIARPHLSDPSSCADEDHDYHTRNFAKHVSRMPTK